MAGRLVHPRRFAAGFGVLLASALALVGAALWSTIGGSSGEAAACADAIPAGRSLDAAWQTTALFVTDVLLNRSPACGYDLSTEHLRHGHSRSEWAQGGSFVHPFPTHLPPVPMVSASPDPKAPEAVYILSRRAAAFVVVGAGGRPEIPMIVGLAAPDAGRGAYNLVLVVERGSWRVDRVRRVAISDSG
jgi:hypothetical protein